MKTHFTITKSFQFSASHQLKRLPKDHPCSRLHGHNYTVEVSLRSENLNETGFVTDYGALSPITIWINEMFDHQHLNDVVDFNPTAELLALYIFQSFEVQFPQLISVTVKETDKTSATYEIES